MLYNTKIIMTKNRVRVIKTSKQLEVGYEVKEERQKNDNQDNEKNDYSYKRALDNLILTIDSNVNYYSKFMTLTFAKTELDYKQAMKKFNQFRQNFKREFGENLKYSRIAERQKKRGEKENNQGSWHFHIIAYNNQKLSFKRLKKIWVYGSVDIKKVDYNKNLALYFGKYFDKQKSDIALNDNLVSHSQGLSRPKVIYGNDIDAFDNYILTYAKDYIKSNADNPELSIQFELREYDLTTK